MNKGLADPLMLREDIKDIVFTYMAKPGANITTPEGKQQLKREIGTAAANHILDPTAAALAAVFIDSATPMSQPAAQTTAAQDLFGGINPAGGVAAIPTDENMFGQDMAGGGIVAMAGGGDVQRFQGMSGSFVQALDDREQRERDRNAMLDTLRKLKAAGMDVLTLPGRGVAGAFESVVTRPLRALGVDLPYLPEDFYGGDRSSITPYMDRLRSAEKTPGGLSAIAPVQPTGSDTGMPSPSGLAAMTPDRIRQAEMLTDPTGGLTNKRMQDEAARAEALKAAREKPAPAPEKEKSAAGPARVAAPAPSGAPDFFTIAEQIKTKVTLPASEDEKKTYADVNQEMRDELKKAGYDFNLIKDQIAERRKDVERLEGSKKEAANMRLIEAGLAILGGESPHAFVNIGKGASKAMQGFQDDIKEIAKNRRELDKDLRQLQTLGNNEALMMTTEGRKRYDAIQKRVEDRKRDEMKLQYDVAREVFKAENDKYLTDVNVESREKIARIQANAPGQMEKIIKKANEGDEFARAYITGRSGKKEIYSFEDALKYVQNRNDYKYKSAAEQIRLANEIFKDVQNTRQVGREGFSAREVK